MTFLMKEATVEWLARRYRWWMLGGAILMFVGSKAGGGGFVAGLLSVWLGACVSTFGDWRTDRGLWMLSAFFLIPAAGLCAGFAYCCAGDIIHHRVGAIGIIEMALCLLLLCIQSRFLLTITASNWKLTHRDEN